jgi:diguanylate cyclase (GGDEF)-like protein/PAS domain S-box-containing protein
MLIEADMPGNIVTENRECLSELLTIAAKPLPLDILLQQSLEVLLSLSWLSFLPQAGIFLSQTNQHGEDELQLIAQTNLGSQIIERCATVKFGHCLCGRAAQMKQACHVDCIDHRHETAFEGMEPHGHYNIPILSGENLLGVIVFYLPEGKQRDEEEVAFISRAAGVLALTIELHRRQFKLENVVRELSFQQRALNEHAIVSITNVKGEITYANDKFCRISGFTLPELLGRNHSLLKSGHHSEQFYQKLWQSISQGQVWHGDIKNKTKDGEYYWVRATIVPFLNEHGAPYQYVAIRTDITEQKSLEEAFSRAQAVANIGNWTFSVQNEILHWSDQIYTILGFDRTKQEPNLQVFISAIFPDDREFVLLEYKKSQDEGNHYDINYRIVRNDTSDVHWVNEKCIHHRDDVGKVIRSDGTIQDITEQKLAQQEIERLAMTDQLTGIANRNQFYLRFDNSVKLAKREGQLLVLMLLDLDKFKSINDTFGHQVGDALLQSVANIMRLNCRDSDVVARLGGDEFAILLVHPDKIGDAQIVAERIITAINHPLDLLGHEVSVTVSIGVSVLSGPSDERDELIRRADLALYESKRSGRNSYHFYSDL